MLWKLNIVFFARLLQIFRHISARQNKNFSIFLIRQFVQCVRHLWAYASMNFAVGVPVLWMQTLRYDDVTYRWVFLIVLPFASHVNVVNLLCLNFGIEAILQSSWTKIFSFQKRKNPWKIQSNWPNCLLCQNSQLNLKPGSEMVQKFTFFPRLKIDSQMISVSVHQTIE